MQTSNLENSLVSFGLPIFNGAPYLSRCLHSLIAQDYLNIEVIIRDDQSNDESLEICRSIIGNDQRFKLSQNRQRLGAHDNFLKTLSYARGEFFVWASQDDWWLPDFCSCLVSRLKANDRAIVAMSAVECFSPD